DPALLEEQLDLLFAQAFDIEGAPRDEQLQMLDPLVRAGEFAGTAGARALFAARGLLAHDLRVQRARTLLREPIRLCIARALVDHDGAHLGDPAAGARAPPGLAKAEAAPPAQLFPPPADAFDVILIMQRRVLHDDAADADRLELGDGRERAGAAHLQLDVPQHGHRALGRELVRDRPAWRTLSGDQPEPLLPVDAIDLVDDAVDVVIEMRALPFDLAMERQQFLDRAAEFRERIGGEAGMLEPLDHAGLRVGEPLVHLAPGV